MSLSLLTRNRLLPKRKNAVVHNSSALPLLRNSGIVNITNDRECQLVSPAEPVRANSPKLTNCSDGLTRTGRSEIDSIQWFTKRSCQKTRALRKEYDGLASPINYCRSLHKRNPEEGFIIIRKLYSSILCYFLFVKEQIDANFVVNTWSDS